MKGFLNSKYFIGIMGLIILLQILISFSTVNYICFFNSDTFYLPSVYDDIFYGYGLEGWRFNPAPNFFPDMISYFILNVIGGEDLRITFFVFSLIQYLVILCFLYKLFKKIMNSKNYNRNFVIGSLLFSLFLTTCVADYNFYYSFQLLSNSYHLGAFVNGLLAFFLTVNYLNNKKKSTAVWLMFIILVASISDKLFIVNYPVVILFLLIFRLRKEKIISSLRILVVFSCTFISLVVFNLIRSVNYVTFEVPPSRFKMELIQDSIEIFSEHMYNVLFSSLVGFLLITISFFSYILLVIRVFVDFRKLNYASLGLFFFLSFTFFAPIISGLYQGEDSLRYSIGFFIISLFVFPFVLDLYKVKQYFNNTIAVLLSFFLLILVIFQSPRMEGLEEYFNHKNTYAETLDELKNTHHLKNGIAQYWSAKKNVVFSKNEVRVYSVFHDFVVYTHVTNRRWFREEIDGSQAVFNFVIIDKEKTLEMVKKTFKNYKLIEKGEVKICITPDFIYPEGQNQLKIVGSL